MSEPTIEVLALADDAGGYYLLRREDLERARVPAEHADAFVRALNGTGDDVAGFITPIPIPGELSVRLLGTFQVRTHLTFEGGGGIGFDPGGGIRPVG